MIIELPCEDCGADVLAEAVRHEDGIYRLGAAALCDTDREHRAQACGHDCPVVCDKCKEHHFGGECK